VGTVLYQQARWIRSLHLTNYTVSERLHNFRMTINNNRKFKFIIIHIMPLFKPLSISVWESG